MTWGVLYKNWQLSSEIQPVSKKRSFDSWVQKYNLNSQNSGLLSSLLYIQAYGYWCRPVKMIIKVCYFIYRFWVGVGWIVKDLIRYASRTKHLPLKVCCRYEISRLHLGLSCLVWSFIIYLLFHVLQVQRR